MQIIIIFQITLSNTLVPSTTPLSQTILNSSTLYCFFSYILAIKRDSIIILRPRPGNLAIVLFPFTENVASCQRQAAVVVLHP